MGKKRAYAAIAIGLSLFFLFAALAIVIACTPGSWTSPGTQSFFVVWGIFGLFIPTLLVGYGAFAYKTAFREKKTEPKLRAEERQMPFTREIIKEREIVKMRCRYCGKLYDERVDKCPHCGASN